MSEDFGLLIAGQGTCECGTIPHSREGFWLIITRRGELFSALFRFLYIYLYIYCFVFDYQGMLHSFLVHAALPFPMQTQKLQSFMNVSFSYKYDFLLNRK